MRAGDAVVQVAVDDDHVGAARVRRSGTTDWKALAPLRLGQRGRERRRALFTGRVVTLAGTAGEWDRENEQHDGRPLSASGAR